MLKYAEVNTHYKNIYGFYIDNNDIDQLDTSIAYWVLESLYW